MGGSSDELTLPKIAVAVELALEGRTVQRVEVFVAEHLGHAFRRQHVLDLLEGETKFLPARATDGSGFALFNKAALIWVGIPLDHGSLPIEEEAETIDSELYDESCNVSIELVSGETMAGEVLYSAPTGHARIGDYLNRPGRFMRVWTTDHLYLVNKAYVVSVGEVADDAPDTTEK
jgi:hypothetical protein